MEWLAPWYDVAEYGPSFAATFQQVLEREVAPGHVLYGIATKALCKRDTSDDVLFQLLDGSERVALVHLTWTKSPPERLPWPATQIFDDIDQWAYECMKPDHKDHC